MYTLKLTTAGGSIFTLTDGSNPSWVSATSNAKTFHYFGDARDFGCALLNPRCFLENARVLFKGVSELASSKGCNVWVVGPRGGWERISPKMKARYFIG